MAEHLIYYELLTGSHWVMVALSAASIVGVVVGVLAGVVSILRLGGS